MASNMRNALSRLDQVVASRHFSDLGGYAQIVQQLWDRAASFAGVDGDHAVLEADVFDVSLTAVPVATTNSMDLPAPENSL